MASEKKTKNECIATEWLEEDNLMLIECWARDGYTFQDIANRIGIAVSTLRGWRAQYPEFDEALKRGREIIDYKVENALLKSALGYKTKEVKVTTTMRYGKVVETVKEVTDKEQAPNVSAIQCWLYNRLPNKWKKNRDNLIELDEEDTKIQVTVTRASQSTKPNAQHDDTVDEEWQDEVNQSIEIRSMTEEEQAEAAKKKAQAKSEGSQKLSTKVESEANDEDLDYWPDDWEDEDEEWED
ncbi:MAG: hypothetical protein IJE78_14775 [Bacteroidaceae bacterium]|nr:hypothetical protein [Bacteroidaceae bacterium]